MASPKPAKPQAATSQMEATPTNFANELPPSLTPLAASSVAPDEEIPVPTVGTVAEGAFVPSRGDSFHHLYLKTAVMWFSSRAGDLVEEI